MTEQIISDELSGRFEEEPAFMLPTHFPPTHGYTGPDGVTRYRAETFGIIEGYRNLLLDVFVPAVASEKPVPVVVWIHGGAFVMGATEEVWSPWFALMRDKILAAGYAFAAVSYRFSSEAQFPAQLLDARAGLRYVRHFAEDLRLDGDRVALWGGSAGGQLALLVALTAGRPEFGQPIGVPGPDTPVRAVVDFFGPTDMLSMNEDDLNGGRVDHEDPGGYMSRLIGGAVGENEDKARAASPITYLRADAPPLLAVHGTADLAVGPGQSRRLVEGLLATGADARLIEIPGADHGFIGEDVDSILDSALAFLAEHLE